MAQFRGGRAQRPRGGRQETGYAAPAADYDYSAQPAYGDDQDVYQVRLYCTVLYCTVLYCTGDCDSSHLQTLQTILN